VGLFLASWAVSGLLWLISEGDDHSWLAAHLDFRLFAYTLAVSLLAGLVFGCAPLLQTWKLDLVTALKDQAGTTASSSRQRIRKVLVAAQVALALILLAGGFHHLQLHNAGGMISLWGDALEALLQAGKCFLQLLNWSIFRKRLLLFRSARL